MSGALYVLLVGLPSVDDVGLLSADERVEVVDEIEEVVVPDVVLVFLLFSSRIFQYWRAD